jgi:hypothetical protein
MSAAVIRFPPRRASAIFVCEERDGDGWLVLARDHGWLQGDRLAALADAHWLAWNLGLLVQELGA